MASLLCSIAVRWVSYIKATLISIFLSWFKTFFLLTGPFSPFTLKLTKFIFLFINNKNETPQSIISSLRVPHECKKNISFSKKATVGKKTALSHRIIRMALSFLRLSPVFFEERINTVIKITLVVISACIDNFPAHFFH